MGAIRCMMPWIGRRGPSVGARAIGFISRSRRHRSNAIGPRTRCPAGVRRHESRHLRGSCARPRTAPRLYRDRPPAREQNAKSYRKHVIPTGPGPARGVAPGPRVPPPRPPPGRGACRSGFGTRVTYFLLQVRLKTAVRAARSRRADRGNTAIPGNPLLASDLHRLVGPCRADQALPKSHALRTYAHRRRAPAPGTGAPPPPLPLGWQPGFKPPSAPGSRRLP